MLYDVVLVTGGNEERHVTIERDQPIVKGDTIHYEMDTYQVVRIDPGHGEFAATVFAEWIGRLGGPEESFRIRASRSSARPRL